MPTTLTDSSSFDAMTAPIGSDIRNAASVRTCLQAAANRDRFVYDMVQPLADIAALKAIASPPNGIVRTVATTGAYVFVAAYVGGEVLPWVVAPTSGSGKWVHVMYGTLGVDGGVSVQHPPLDDIAALKALANPSNNDVRLVKSKGSYVFYAGNSTPEIVPYVVQPTVGTGRWFLAQDASSWKLDVADSIALSGWTDSPSWWDIGSRNFPSIRTNDRFVIDAFAELGTISGSEGEARCVLVTPTGTDELGSVSFDGDRTFICLGSPPFVNPGDEGAYSVKLQLKKTDGGPSNVGVRRGTLRVQLFRVA